MVFRRDSRWTDAQWELLSWWSNLPRSKSNTALTPEVLERGETRRKVEHVQEELQRKRDEKEVWDE